MDGDHRVTIEGSDGTKIDTTIGEMRKAADRLDGKDAAQARVRSFIGRIETLEEEKKEVADQIKEVYDEAKGEGFSPKAIKEIVKLRRMNPDERQELATLVEIYAESLADFGETPLGAFLSGAAKP